MERDNATKRAYLIQLPLPAGGGYFDLCRASSPESAAEIVRCLLASGDQSLLEIRILPVQA